MLYHPLTIPTCSISASSVPDDSQWQKKRSKLHNLLFGNHGSPSSRAETPEPTNDHEEVQGTRSVNTDSRSHVEEKSEKKFEVLSQSSCSETMKTELDFGAEQQPSIKIENIEVINTD